MENRYIYHTLSCGLRCVYTYAPGLAEVCGIAVDAGSRDEDESRHGLAHFVEHTLFKGTSKRRAWHILNRMEAVGGELNAYTTKETTTVYSIYPSGNSGRAIDLIADLVCNSLFPIAELDKEREVVADEINSYLDMPMEAVFDDIDEIVFRGNPLAHNILGNVATLATFYSEKCREWVTTRYGAENMVFFFSGGESAEKVFRMAEKAFAPIEARRVKKPIRVVPVVPDCERINSVSRGGHQAHTVMAARVPGMFSEHRYALGLFANMLGGPGMNSLLNLEMRERRGLVYNAEASTALYTDCGLLTIYFGCDPKDTAKCRRIANDCFNRLMNCDFTVAKFENAKRQYLGQMAIGSENRENSALGMARGFLYRNEVLTPEYVRDVISALTVADFRNMVENIGGFVELTLC